MKRFILFVPAGTAIAVPLPPAMPIPMINASTEGASLSYEEKRSLIMMTIDISIHFANHGGKRFITAIDFNPERKINLLQGA